MKLRSHLALLAVVAAVVAPERGATQSRGGARVSPAVAAQAASGPVRVLVRLDVPTVAEAALADSAAIAVQRGRIERAQDAALAGLESSLDAVTRFEQLPGFAATVEAGALRRLAAAPGVAAIEEDHLMTPSLIESTRLIGAESLWQQGVEGAGWAVAVLDTALADQHPALRQAIIAQACFSTTQSGVSTSLCAGGVSSQIGPGAASCPGCTHGTAVAGAAAGRMVEIVMTPPRDRVSGVARAANIVAVQVFSQLSGGGQGSFASDQIRALEHIDALAAAGMDIAAVNMSLGSPTRHYSATCDQDNTLLTQAVNNLRARGIATIVASGNDGLPSELSVPACLSNVISVGSTDKNDQVSSFSNRSARLHLTAPGQNIRAPAPGDTFAVSSGTSLAAPHVAGAWALMKSRSPRATVDQIYQALRRSATSVYDPTTGLNLPRINVDRAVQLLGAAPGAPTHVTVTVAGSMVTATWEPPADGSTPSSYQVEILSSAGSTVAVVDVGTSRVFNTSLPAGQYLLRVRAFTGGIGTASNDFPFTIGSIPNTQIPLAPSAFRADLSGATLTLSWNLPVDSPPATGFIIDVGTAPSLSNLGSFDTGSAATRFVTGVPLPGVYFVRMRARNAFGVSGPSNEVVLNVAGTGGCHAAPLAPANLHATVVGSLATLTWSQPLASAAVSGYTLEAGSAPGLGNLARVPVGSTTTFSAQVPSGLYYVRVRANNACGQSAASNEVALIVP